MKNQNLWERIKRLDDELLDLIYPPRCPFCDRIAESRNRICPECRRKIHWIQEPVCKKCGKPLSDSQREFCPDCERRKHIFVQGKALWVYEKSVTKSLYRFKYQNKREYGKVYAQEMAERHGAWIRKRNIQAIVPVPLHKKRKKKRGYNQAEILARELGRILEIPVYTDLLIRIRNTKPQKMLNLSERKNNLKKAFKTTKSSVQLQYILIVDDIYTTGSTLDAVATALTEAGVAGVYVCCVSTGRGC